MEYQFNELTDMHLILGECKMNCRAAARRYAEKFPNRRIPHHTTFSAVDRRLREFGTFKKRSSDCGRARQVPVNLEENILNAVEEDGSESVRKLQRQFGCSKSTIHRTLQMQLLKPYHLQRVQELKEEDYLPRMQFCQWLVDGFVRENHFLENIFFTDESCFTRNGVVNFHNLHIWSDENPRETRPNSFQRQFSINVWAGIIGNCMIGPIELPQRLNGDSYLLFLRETLPPLLENIPLITRMSMFYMHDGAPPHFAVPVREYLNQRYPNRWIGRGDDAPVKWPPRSPDINPVDFYLWGHLKESVYKTPVQTKEELWERILAVSNEIKQNPQVFQKVRWSLLRRSHACIGCNGGLFEHLIK